VIEALVEEMMQHLCSDNMPDRIELGDSPTLTTKLNRKFAYEGAAASRLSSASGAAAPTASDAALQSPAAASVTPLQQQLQARLSSSSGVKPGAKAAADARVVRVFMESHCSQLTPFGLMSLADNLKEHQLAVFFRNNHFNTLFKYEGGVYLLVTDQGYECEPDIVWERLDSVNGDTTFCTGGFTAFVPHREPEDPASYSQVAAGGVHPALTDFDAAIAASLAAAEESHNGSGDVSGRNTLHDVSQQEPAAGAGHEDADFALALQLHLQEEEAARVAQERQQQQSNQGRGSQQQSRVRQLQEQQQQQQQASGQFTAESLAAGVRQVGRRIVSSAEKAASNLAQQRQQYVQQQQAMHAAQQQEQAVQYAVAQQQQQHVSQHQRQHMMHQQRQHARAQHATGGSRKQQEDKCCIM
jgi:hypothetical protein